MKQTILNQTTNIFTGILLTILGILFFISYEYIWNIIYYIAIITMVFFNISHILNIFKHQQKLNILFLIFDIIILLAIVINKQNFETMIHIIIAYWILLRAIVKLIDGYRCKIDMIHGTITNFLSAVINIIIFIILSLEPSGKFKLFSYIIGIYLVIYGLVYIINNIIDILPNHVQDTIKYHKAISLPIIIDILIPKSFYLSLDYFNNISKLEYTNDPSKDKPLDIEVYIYLKEKGPESLGHIDIAYNGTIYSYGCHDPKHRKLMGTFGDGVLIEADRDLFLKQAMSDHKRIISYGLKLNDKEKNILDKRIKELLNRTTPWSCEAKEAIDNGNDATNINDYASRVYKATHCKMYKFTSGKFKTYFVATTNCVLLTDHLIRCKELNLINISGIIIPGSYLKYLNEEYLRKDTIVVKRMIYENN